jgi:biotin carboxylase/predicted MFS family arabinose efflux permease
MRLDGYRRLLALPGLRTVLLLGLFAKVPVVAIPMVLTLHVTVGHHGGFGRAGLVMAAWTVGVAVGAPVQGRCLDRYGARPLFAVATTGQALFWGLAPHMSYPVLVATAMASGFVLVPGTTISRLAVASLVPQRLRHTAFVMDSMLTNLSYMTGPALGVVLATQVSTTAALTGVGVLLVASGVCVVACDPPLATLAGEPAVARPPLRRLLRGGLLAALACAFAAGVTSSGTEIAVVGALKHMDRITWTSQAMVLFAVCSIAGGLVYGGLRRSPSGALLVGALGLVIVPLGRLDTAPGLTLALVPAALLYAPAFAATAADASRYAHGGVRGVVMSVYSSCVTVGTALGGPLTGFALDTGGPAWAFAAIGGFAMFVAVLAHARLGTPRAERSAAEHQRREPTMQAVKHVVVVDTYGPTLRLVDRFREAGAALVRVQSTPEVPSVYRSSATTHGYVANIVHDGDLAATVRRVSAYGPIAVVAGGEIGVELADALSTELGLPSNGVALSDARRDKYVMVETIRRAGVPAARQILVDGDEQLDGWHRSIGGRVVLKPVRSAAGDQVMFCDTPEESIAAFHGIRGAKNIFSQHNTGVVAQEYLCGTEYMVNTVSRDGHHRVCEIWRTSRVQANGVPDIGDAAFVLPRRGDVPDVLADYACRVLDALGILHGPAHVEIKLTNAGPRLVEIGARIAGGDIPSYAQLAMGESQLDWTVHAYLDPEHFHAHADQDYERRRCVGNVALISPVDGILRGYRDLDAIRALESFQELQLHIQPGERIRRTVDDVTYAGALVLAHDTEEVVLRDANTVRYLDGVSFYELETEGARGGQR